MEEKNITPKESLEIISHMIESTKQRFRLSDGNTLLLWGYLSIAVCLLTSAVLIYTRQNAWNFLWALIPAVGVPGSIYLDKKSDRQSGAAKTWLETLSSRLWTYLGWTQLLVALVCTVFTIKGINVWAAMAFFSMINVGFAASVFGMIIKEKSMVIGGFVSFASGVALVCCKMAGVPIPYWWFVALFILAFAVMFVVPGHSLNHKVKSSSK